ncbi:hypothetical protein CEP54_006028 [Fusarium duplospermum]|uniref:Uncharacterized protein n=1 Tax=Fusarium duplospermum TaxID=1325734 RepID=A0A428Q9B9_9HYPO|nr:hypothetical protein CEP54_006028 [Fusarium duplospermum]
MEKCRLNDLTGASLGIKLGRRLEDVTVTLESRNELPNKVFDRWNSSSSRGTSDPTLRSGDIREKSFSAGTWSRDLGTEPKEGRSQKGSKAATDGTTQSKKAKPSKKRKRDDDDDDDEPPKKLERREESRLCSAETFLYMVLADGAPTWKWRDASGQTASGRSVDYYDGVTPLDVFIQAVDCHDMFEEARVKEFNEKLVLAHARRRIRNWAEAGSRCAAIIDPSESLANKLKSPTLIADQLQKQRDFYDKVITGLHQFWAIEGACHHG